MPEVETANLTDEELALVIQESINALKSFRQRGARTLPKTREMLRQAGVFPLLDHYYEPLFQPKHLRYDLSQERDLPGIDFNLDEQLALLQALPYRDELIGLHLEKRTENFADFYVHNGAFCSGDAEFLYQFIRHTKPKTVLEVGSGQSTILARKALNTNFLEDRITSKHICIEPYEYPQLGELGVQIIRRRVEECDLSLFESLEAGDLLFIDSSHMIRPQGDVLFLYLQVLPQLKPGVFVHIHDIFTPRDYLAEWIIDDVKFWNEQYLLEALLTHTSKYKVIAALNLLHHRHYDALATVCPYLTPEREPGSFYLETL